MPDSAYTDSAAPAPLHRRVLQTFAAPGELFRGLREQAPWVGPLALSIAVGMLVVLAVPDQAFVEATEGAVNRRGRPVEITSDPETIVRYGRLMGMLVAVVRQPLAAFAFAGLLTLVFSLLLRGRARFLQYLAVTTHAFLITALGSLLAVLVAVLRGTEPEGITPALLPGIPAGTFLHRVLAGTDLFTVWAILFAALGVSMLDRNRSWGTASAILLGAYLAVVAALAALTA
ncbi:MAG TPA: YIP1 family protein [Longimicrobiaceae bacterium]|nr:YIP1 family protein [Longimicrobiaceae bacterium]